MNLPPEQESIRAKCFHPSGRFVEFEQEDIEQSISDRFEKIVREHAGRLAVKARACSLTYTALNHAANQIAHAILLQRGQATESIGCLLSPGAARAAAMLGVFKAGKIYVLLNPSFPETRIKFMLRDSQSTVILTDHDHLAMAEGLVEDGARLINVDDLDASLSIDNPGVSVSPDAYAWISYTSGSTGQPKAVVQNHRNLLHLFMTQTNDLHICSEDKLLTLTSVAGELLLAVLNGASVFPVNIQKEGMAGLSDWLMHEEMTVYNSVPSIFRQFAKSLRGDERFPKLRLIRFTGEALYRADVELYKKYCCESCIVVNRLSSNEVPAFRQYFIDHSTVLPDGVVPVGYAIGDYDVRLIGADGQEVGINEIGEIAVKGRHLAPGYWRNPDLTQAKFSSISREAEERIFKTGDLGRVNSDGCLFYLGRQDFQVKIRGNRVEISEIESALIELKSVKEAVVLAREHARGEKRLVAYVVPATHPGPTVTALRKQLAEKLPQYMIPSVFVSLDALPLIGAGKVDRQALPEPEPRRARLDTKYAVPRSPVEEVLVGIWADLLSIDRVGIHDNFFDLGGDSLTATQVVMQVIKNFQLEIPIRCVFESPTVSEMAAVISQHQGKHLSNEELASIVAELESLQDEDAQRLINQSGVDSKT